MAATKEFGSSPSKAENTVIGPSILISGKLSGDEDLTVRGRLEGEVQLSKTLILEPSGIVKANVRVRNAVVSGVVVGNIVAEESVELTKEGRMVGDIKAPRVIIVEGASFRGRVDMGDLQPSRNAGDRPAARPVVRAQVRAAAPLPPAKPAAKGAVAPTGGARPAPPPPPLMRGEAVRPPAPPVAPSFADAKKKVVVKKKK